MITLFDTICDEEEIALVGEVLRSGKLVNWDHSLGLENKMGAYLGWDGVVTCASGTDALTLVLEELCRPGWQVMVPAMTFSATYEAVLKANCVPIVCDVDPTTLTPTVEQVRSALTAETMAVILVHLHGWPASDMTLIKELCDLEGVMLIEDCAQAFGAMLDGQPVGTFGDGAAFSFYPTKPLGGIGDGGAAFLSEPKAVHARARRNHGRVDGRQEFAGYNSRLDETNARVLLKRLARYPEKLEALHILCSRYQDRIGQFKRPGVPAPYVFPIQVNDRSAVMARLVDAGIESRPHYDPAISELPYVKATCPFAWTASKRILSLPCHAGMTLDDVDKVCDVVRGKT